MHNLDFEAECLPHFSPMFHFYTLKYLIPSIPEIPSIPLLYPENVTKPLVFGHFQGV